MMDQDRSGPDDYSPSHVWAQEYRALELSVIPAVRGEKRPLSTWKEFQENGIPAATFERWYGVNGEYRNYSQMGFITGRACLDADSALFTVDLDVKSDGLATWRALLATHNNNMEFETWTARTGSGGRHLHFRCPDHLCPGTGKGGRNGVDIRGVGGFIMVPPSAHHIPNTFYEWEPGRSPWETEIADAPDWLIEFANSIARAADGERTEQVAEEVQREKDAFGLDTGKAEEGRETLMQHMVYAAFLHLTRKFIRVPTLDELLQDVWPVWQETAKIRVEGKPERGFTQVREKCRYVLDRFQRGDLPFKTLDEIMDGADKEGDPSSPGADWSSAFKPGGAANPGQAGGIVIQSSAEFVGEWSPKPFLLKPIIEVGRFYTLTGPTGTGKTAIALLIAQHIAQGDEMAGRRVQRAPVLFLAGENHEDVRTRWLTMLKMDGINPDHIDVNFVGGRFSIEGHFTTVKEHMEANATKLVIVDTLQAFFDGDDSNSNEQMKAMAHTLRRIANLGPAVLVPAHPIKAATKDRNVPYGGGALLNEVDGNLSLWGDPEAVQLSWCGKFRGSFEPVDFALDVVEMPGVVDPDGDPIKTVKARTLGKLEVEMKAQQADQMARRLLFVILDHKGLSARKIGAEYARKYPGDAASPNTVLRRVQALTSEGLVERILGGLHLTTKGKKLVGHED